jgi:hypothetical protein
MWKRWILACLITTPAWGYKLTQDFTKGFYWATLPIGITVIESNPTRKATLERIARTAIGEWESDTGIALWDFTQTTASAAATNIIRWSTNFAAETNMDASSVLAVAIRYVNGPYFAKTEIVINGGHSLNQNDYFLRTTLTHELGHTMGLDHSDVSSAVMAPSLQLQYLGLQNDDVEGMKAAYEETDRRQVTGYISPLAYSKETSSSAPLSCGTVGTAGSSAMNLNAGLSLASGLLITFLRKLVRWFKSLL